MFGYFEKLKNKNKNAIVTGGCGLLGSHLTQALAESEAFVLIADIDENRGQQLSKEINEKGGLADFTFFDLTQTDKIEDSVKEIWDKVGGIDIWVNSGFPRAEGWRTSPNYISPKSWADNINYHLNSYCLSSLYLAELMKTNEAKGTIINIGSIFGMVGHDFTIYDMENFFPAIPYTAIKGGIINFTRFIASKYGSYGIRANAVSPGGITKNVKPISDLEKKFSDRTLLKRMANPEEIASVVSFLSSEAASYITGANIVVDGGWTAV